ncbi:anaphase-promoting complex, subunit 10-domain-containing protein [Lentinula detonsa]|uniref:Anaphase-promoting complex subunit 10 n=1 Tax=Lentinula detonsa TaxID=2804962 RepID=A0A9W8NZW3_9AGAR|nr:anaphase-promoting complex, subunit 10-domain-containing protein [Lentinula detonsa]KAJ3800668.1 anaphase-promoting complex, subunit 10-domain-containing protein [Lentinula aff. detonsa]KAJ3985619.1 anaphase-promoting complex, subunit 10-domain-containing protein [Lentinula detonsa]
MSAPVATPVNVATGTTQPAPEDLNSPFILTNDKRPPILPWPNISGQAKWSVSSYKFGFGTECLLDGDPETFWHSDGPQPHFITIEFPRKVAIQKLSIFLCHPLDDSYTPSTLAIRAGTGPNDLQDVRIITLEKPDGWLTFDISSEPNEGGEGLKPVHAYILQLIILTNHMSGKDTHVRGLSVLGPIEEAVGEEDPFPWASTEFKMHETIR